MVNLKVESRVKIALRAIQIANFVGLNQIQKIPADLEALQTNHRQPDTFKVGWSFEGTEPKLARYREWLVQLFQALEIKAGREAMLAALRELRASWQVVSKKK